MDRTDVRKVLAFYLVDSTDQASATLVRHLLCLAKTSPEDFFSLRDEFEALGYATPAADSVRHFFEQVAEDERLCHSCRKGWLLDLNTVSVEGGAIRHYRCSNGDCAVDNIKLS